jgi:hypothetical protein
MRKYKVNRTGEQKLPSKETIEKYKDFSRLSHEYDRLTKRPKVPLYKDKRMFLILLLIVLMAFLLAEAGDGKDDNKNERDKDTTNLQHQSPPADQ